MTRRTNKNQVETCFVAFVGKEMYKLFKFLKKRVSKK